MIREIEALGVDAAVREAAHAGARPAGTHENCLNCEAGLQGPYCHACGQGADDRHRSIGHLIWEAVEGFTHLDGRLAQTLPALLIRPGALARDHMDGKRQRHVPPFRLFLITLLVFMFSAEVALNDGARTSAPPRGPAPQVSRTYSVGKQKVVVVTGMSALKEELDSEPAQAGFEAWLREHIGRAVQNREYFLMLVFEWAHRLAVLMLPILAGLLTLAYVNNRRFYVYDHLVVAMQYLSFCFLVWAPVWMAPKWLSDWLFFAAVIWTPLNLYLILRRAYGSGRLAAAAKALTLWCSTVVLFGLLLVGVVFYALRQL